MSYNYRKTNSIHLNELSTHYIDKLNKSVLSLVFFQKEGVLTHLLDNLLVVTERLESTLDFKKKQNMMELLSTAYSMLSMLLHQTIGFIG